MMERGTVVRVKRRKAEWILRTPFTTASGIEGWWAVPASKAASVHGHVRPLRTADLVVVKEGGGK